MRSLTLLLAGAAMLSLAACKGGDSDDSDGDTDSETNTACLATDDVSPSILSGTIRCAPPLQDDQPPFLYMSITATDPQGDFTLKTFGGGNMFKAYLAANDQESASDPAITCSADTAGQCEGSISGDQIGVACGTMNNFYFTAIVADDDGNTSPECRLVID